MRAKDGVKKFLPLPVFYLLRDVYSTARDVWNFTLIRNEYTNFSFFQNLLSSLRIFLWPAKTILCYPDRPSKYHVIYKLCAVFGYKISTNPRKNDVPVFWSHSSTFPDKETIQPLLENRGKVINSGCTNLSKELVGQVFEETFGYSLDVDPMNYRGTLIEKSIYNGTNFAKIMEGPIAKEDVRADFVYQKMIETLSDSDELTLVHRVPVYNGEIPVVYLKFRPHEFQFTGFYSDVEVKNPKDVFSKNELNKIILMNKKMGIDYGECDVLRDRDGKIYVVDVNSHPGGPPRKMSHEQKAESAEMLRTSFNRLIENFS